ncbi:hypothetical protein, partial [Nocardia seriolae]
NESTTHDTSRVTESSHNIRGHGEFGFLFGFGLAGLKKAAHYHAGVSRRAPAHCGLLWLLL